LIFLIFRQKSNDNVNFNFYLVEWLKLIRTNEIVFINIIGNFVLFIPLIFYLNKKFAILKIIILILLLELLQLITKRGVFDIVDIILNLFGVFIGTIIKRRIYGK